MAIKAGRVGVARSDVDELGHVTGGGLTPEQKTKLDKALVTPVSLPLEKELVGVDTGNSQIMIKIGAGLKLTGDTSPFTLESESTGGGGVYAKVGDGNSVPFEMSNGAFSASETYKTAYIDISGLSGDILVLKNSGNASASTSVTMAFGAEIPDADAVNTGFTQNITLPKHSATNFAFNELAKPTDAKYLYVCGNATYITDTEFYIVTKGI